MKKLISAVLALAMIASLGLTAFADNPITNESDPKKANVVVKTIIDDDETYSVAIPADLEIEWGDSTVKDMNPQVTSQLKLGAKLTVTVTDEDDGKKLKNAGYAAGLDYTPTGLDTPYTFNEINTDAIPNSTANTVSVQVPDFTGVPIAVYQTTLTYTVEYVPPVGP